MPIQELDVVVLKTPLPLHGLERGDLGAVVTVYSPDTFEVEFVRGSGMTQAIVTLTVDQIRPVGEDDIPSVRKQVAA